jgi:hypothetical protein
MGVFKQIYAPQRFALNFLIQNIEILESKKVAKNTN